MQFLRKKRAKTRIERTKKKNTNPKVVLVRQIVIGFLLFLFVGLLVIGIWYGSRIEKFTIAEVEVTGGETISHDALLKIVEEELEGAYYKIVPRRFAWTYSEDSMISRISEINRLKNVHIERVSGTKLVVVFEEYKPFALWCSNIESTDCLFMDREGFAFSWAPKLQGSAFLRFSEVGRDPERFATGFDGSYIRDTDEFIKKAYDELGMNITHVERTGEEELVYHIAGGGKLKVSRRLTPEETLKNLTTLLSSEAFSHIEPGNFQYIDLRYGNKIFVNEEDPNAVVATTTASST